MYSKGNPTQIGSTINLTWVNGRELNTYTDSSKNLSISYKYDDSGIRVEKNVNNAISKYYLEGNKVIFEDRGGTILYYFYDESGIAGLEVGGNTYYFVKNLQGDIIQILDGSLSVIANYKYSSWGEIISITDQNGVDISENTSHIANINPMRYRGYYYDVETELYYLNSRYYNPEFGRFINSDSILGTSNSVLAYNLYAYCENNPIGCSDPTGHTPAEALMWAANNPAPSVFLTGYKPNPAYTAWKKTMDALSAKPADKIRLTLGVQPVAFGNYHSTLVITSVTGAKLNSDFTNSFAGTSYATLGAGGNAWLGFSGNLVNNANRYRDKNLNNKVQMIYLGEINMATVDKLWSLNVKTGTPYDLFAKTGVNSNSYAYSALYEIGITGIQPSYNVPGWGKLVPWN